MSFSGFLFPFFQKKPREGTRNYMLMSHVFLLEELKETNFFKRVENRNLTYLEINSTVFTKTKICFTVDLTS